MFRLVFSAVFVLGAFAFCSPAMAQDGVGLLGQSEALDLKAIGAGIAVLGAGLEVQTAMIIAAALIEGAAFAAILFTFFI